MLAAKAVSKVIELLPIGSDILDIGSGAGLQAKAFRKAGMKVTTLDFGVSKYAQGSNHDIVGDFYDLNICQFNCAWSSHVLEHQPNPNLFLSKCREMLKPGGLLAVTVPPHKDQIVGGHVTLWNAGILIYQAVLAGFDCSKARVSSYGYNITLIVEKPSKSKSDEIQSIRLDWDIGDIERLARYFPEGCRKQGFNGIIPSLNWGNPKPPDSAKIGFTGA